MKRISWLFVLSMLLLQTGCGIFTRINLEEKPQYPDWHCESNAQGEVLLYTQMPISEAKKLAKNLIGWSTLLIDWHYMYLPLPDKPFWVNVIVIYRNCDTVTESLREYGLDNPCSCARQDI